MYKDNRTFREWLLEQIKDEDEAVTRNENDPQRYSEWGNAMIQERIKEHTLLRGTYEDALREYDSRENILPVEAKDGDMRETQKGKWVYMNGRWVSLDEVVEKWLSLKL
jgi:hypothetical protein